MVKDSDLNRYNFTVHKVLHCPPDDLVFASGHTSSLKVCDSSGLPTHLVLPPGRA